MGYSPKDIARIESQDFVAIEEELRAGEGCAISRLENRLADPEPHGSRRGELSRLTASLHNLTPQQREEMASHMDEGAEVQEGFFPNDEKTQKYGNLLFLLQSEPRHIAHLCRLVTMAEIDSLLQTVMFTIYGNQYESREEHLLLTMFQVFRHLGWRRNQLTVTVRSHLPIRPHSRIFLASPRKYSSVTHDDDLHPKRSRSELSESSFG